MVGVSDYVIVWVRRRDSTGLALSLVLGPVAVRCIGGRSSQAKP